MNYRLPDIPLQWPDVRFEPRHPLYPLSDDDHHAIDGAIARVMALPRFARQWSEAVTADTRSDTYEASYNDGYLQSMVDLIIAAVWEAIPQHRDAGALYVNERGASDDGWDE